MQLPDADVIMVSHNASDDDVTLSVNGFPLLWLPYVVIVVIFVVFLAVNFGLYHRKVRERYRRKKEELAMRKGVYAKRRILSLMRADFHPGQQEDKSARGDAEVPREATAPALFLTPHSPGHLPSSSRGSVFLPKASAIGDDEIDVDAMNVSTGAQSPRVRRPKKKRRGLGKFKGSAESELAADTACTPRSGMRWRDGVDGEIPKKKRSRMFGGNIIMSSMMNTLQSSESSRSGSN